MTFFGATLLTAIATAVLAVFAVVTAWYARKAFREQSKEVADQARMLQVQSGQLDEQRKINAEQTRVLELQARELMESLSERRREAERRLRGQASRIFMTEEKRYAPLDGSGKPATNPWISVTVQNSSDLPVYNAVIEWHPEPTFPFGSSDPNPPGVLLPGAITEHSRAYPHDTDLEKCGAVLLFTDAAAVRWVRRPDGYLEEHA